jgi:NAD(P)-dependent dehydrogenase (short-subunit alcohol dehydrogenase family)
MAEVVVITGASGGIGRATARRFAREGASSRAARARHAGLEGAAREVRGARRTRARPPDRRRRSRPGRACGNDAEVELGPIDVWINDAMVTVYSEFLDIEPEEFRRATTSRITAWSGVRAPRYAG